MPVQKVTKDNFQRLVVASEMPVLLDFWATWCGPCRMIAPIVEQIASEREDIVVGKINVDEEMELAIQFGVSSIPCLVVLKHGQEVDRSVGFEPQPAIQAFLEKHL